MSESTHMTDAELKAYALGYARGQRKIIKLLESEIATWQRTPSFNYRKTLQTIIERVKNV